jgi:hypothetical protein
VCELGSDHAVLRERAVDRRGGVKLHVLAEVVAPSAALPAFSAVLLRFDGDAFTDSTLRHLFPHCDDPAGQLMAQDQWTSDDKFADPTMPVVVSVGAADSHGSNFDQDFIAGYGRCWHLLDAECLYAGEDARTHRLWNGCRGVSAGGLGHGDDSLSLPHIVMRCREAWLGLVRQEGE